jgi:hypothetical protein
MNEFLSNLGQLFLGAVAVVCLSAWAGGWTLGFCFSSPVSIFLLLAIVPLAAMITIENQEQRLNQLGEHVRE